MAEDIDVRAISAFSSLPENTITTLRQTPTPELIDEILRAFVPRIKECEQTKAKQVKTEIELETYTRKNDSKVKALSESRDKALEQAGKLRGELQVAGEHSACTGFIDLPLM